MDVFDQISPNGEMSDWKVIQKGGAELDRELKYSR